MPSLFPGMDPYLEDSENWRSFHHLLADEIMTQLNTLLSAKYYADVEVRTLLEELGIATNYPIYPDAAVLETNPLVPSGVSVASTPAAPIQRVAMPAERVKSRTVAVYVAETKKLVTAIELLSPVNKRGDGLESYRLKRARILRSTVNLVEIDLLRAGQRPGWEVDEPTIDTDYVLLVNRAQAGLDRISDIWPVALHQSLPNLPIPLLYPDPDVVLDLGQVVQNVYGRGAYARRIDYRRPLPPPQPRPVIAAWLAQQN